MNRIVFFIFLVFPFLGFAQKSNYLKTYYPKINKAEEFILEDDFLNAGRQYKLAFDSTGNGFIKDYFNAAVCAAFLGEGDQIYHYLDKLASKGLSLDFIKSEVAFSSIQKDEDWRKYELSYLEKKRKAESSINKELKEKLDALVEEGMFFRRRDPSLFADSIKVVDAKNSLELEKLIKEYGFPGEDEIGLDKSGMPLISYDFYEIIKRDKGEAQTVNFSNLLLTAIREGKLEPHMATYLLALSNLNDEFFSRAMFKITGEGLGLKENKEKLNKWVYVPIEEESKEYINSLRIANGMESIENYRKKILFSLSDVRFLFPYKIYAGVWYVTDPAIAEQYLTGTKIVEEE